MGPRILFQQVKILFPPLRWLGHIQVSVPLCLSQPLVVWVSTFRSYVLVQCLVPGAGSVHKKFLSLCKLIKQFAFVVSQHLP